MVVRTGGYVMGNWVGEEGNMKWVPCGKGETCSGL